MCEIITGLVADIQHTSSHDGPGIRTTVFLKGCPLHCPWCHNPECISFKPQILNYPAKCIGCHRCAEGCFAGAKVLCGQLWTPDQLIDEVLLDQPYYGKDGGVTLSGGEPLAQAAFAADFLRRCQEFKIGTAVETSLYAAWDTAWSVLQYSHLVMADLKVWDSELHQAITGVPNLQVINNLRALGTQGIPLILRTPIIPGISDSPANIAAIAAFAAGLPNLVCYELLPYHPLGLGKAAAVGAAETRYAIPEHEAMQQLGLLAAKAGIPVKISGVFVK